MFVPEQEITGVCTYAGAESGFSGGGARIEDGVFRRIAVIVWACTNRKKALFHIELPSRQVRFANLQVKSRTPVSLRGFNQRAQESARESSPAKPFADDDVLDLPFAGQNTRADER